MNFKNYLKESTKIKNPDYVVLHTSVEYEPMATGLATNELKKYFSEDNGFDEDELKNIQKMKTGEVYKEIYSIIIVKLS
jgi:hypothetical protein